MLTKIAFVTLLVRNYDEAIDFYVGKIGFELLSNDTYGNGSRWVTLTPSKVSGTAVVMVEADTPGKAERVGTQAADHVFLVVHTDDCRRDYEAMRARGVSFWSEPREVPWGVEAVFEDLYGNRLDLVQFRPFRS
jgi:catechol 2,3-dioxygenase-like lactoylglutathione lyase family enzyme